MRIPILILAAGASRRLGQPKQLLRLGGQTLLERAIATAQGSQAEAVYVVLGAQADQILTRLSPFPVPVWVNPDWEAGMSSSLRLGLAQLTEMTPAYDAALVMLGDQPGLDSAALDQLIDAHAAKPGRVIAADYGTKAGVPAIFPRACWPELQQLSGDQGARQWLARKSEAVQRVALGDLQDIDTWKDYRRLLEE
jgi:molybdenum cofactor cytidylyltransferase